MLITPGQFGTFRQFRHDPILSVKSLNHYSDPALSQKIFHSGGGGGGSIKIPEINSLTTREILDFQLAQEASASTNYLKEVRPIKGANILEQPVLGSAMHFDPTFFNGLGGYGFEDVARWMMYDADPTPFQVERTIGMVIDTPGPFGNNQIFGLSKFNAFNTHWRLSSSTSQGGRITYGRAENHPSGEFPSLVTGVTGNSDIIIVRHVSLTRHEFYINSPTNPVIIDPNDAYWTSNRARLMLGRIGGTRSETGVKIGPIFDAFSLVSPAHLQKIMQFWSARASIDLTP